MSPPGCVFDGEAAIARFALPGGCVARRDDRVQDLCYHHAMRAEPLAGMVLLEDYSEGKRFTEEVWRR